jgi:hypothetical protein
MNINLLYRLIVISLCPLACSTAGSPASSVNGPTDSDAGTDSASTDGAPSTSVGLPDAAMSVQPVAPGYYVADPSVSGAGACTSKTLGDVLTAIRAANPALGAVTTIYNPTQQSTGDGNFVYPYQTSDGGFAIVFKRGAGDCPAGCTDNTYDYFQTDDSCAPAQVGHYHEVSGTCLQVDGTPMWDHPPSPPDPSLVCGADNTPQMISGQYSLRAVGQSQPCAASGDTPSSNAIDTTVTLTIVQSGANAATGVVSFAGTGNALVDNVGLPAQFIRRRFEAMLQKNNLPSTCLQEYAVTAQYDFENALPGTLTVTQVGDTNCSLCKGGLALTLTPLTDQGVSAKQ